MLCIVKYSRDLRTILQEISSSLSLTHKGFFSPQLSPLGSPDSPDHPQAFLSQFKNIIIATIFSTARSRPKMHLSKTLSLVVLGFAAKALGQSCSTVTVSDGYPTSTALAFHEYSYCSGVLNAQAYVEVGIY